MITQTITEKEAMELALKEASLGRATVSPNPPVGAVVISADGNLISKGHHKRAGEPHAEIEALKNVNLNDLQGATLVVTLEPCAHEGRTPSCAKRLASLPLKKVIYGMIDPNPLVAGKGIEILKKAKIEVVSFSPEFHQQLEEVAEIFLLNMRKHRPFVALKAATTINAKIRKKDGPLNQQITGSESLKKVHELRSLYDAILVGRGTFEIDNPRLNVRLDNFKKENYVVVLDFNLKSLESLKSSNILKVHKPHKIVWAVSSQKIDLAKKILISQNMHDVQLVSMKAMDQLDELLEQLWQLNIKSVFIEGGPKVWQTFITKKMMDRLYWFKSSERFNKEDVSWLPDLQIENENSLPLQAIHKSTESLGLDSLISIRFNT